MRFLKFAFILLSFGLFVFACSQSDTTQTTNVTSTNTNAAATPFAQPTAANDEMASAKKNYTEKCARCHKDDGSGGKIEIEGEKINAKSLISQNAKKDPDSEVIEAIEKGFPEDGMPAFKGKLTDTEIKDVVAYIRKELQK
ncbi:MAG: cytochrome c [Pyrinomonadaceae bacterium]